MKTTQSGKRYDSDYMEALAENTSYSNGNNVSGGQYLKIASDGTFWLYQTSNGQDGYRDSFLRYLGETPECARDALDEYVLDEITEKQEERLIELKIIEIVP